MENSQTESANLLPGQLKKTGLGIGKTVFLLAGELIGTGIVTLPYSMVTAGPAGFILFVVVTLLCCYGGVTLGRCWQIIIERDPTYDQHIRDPYPVMGEISCGKYMRIFVRFLVYLMQFGAGVVILLLAAQMAVAIAEDNNLKYCYWIMIFCAAVGPFMWLGSPKDFWLAGFIALSSVVLAAIFIIASVLVDNNPYNVEFSRPPVTFNAFILSFATVAFANSGIPTFPTIQNDMKNKNQFALVVIISNAIMLGLCLPITTVVYFNFKGVVDTNILLSLKPGYLSTIGKGCMIAHTTLAYLILINPVAQDIEENIGIPKKFSYKRVLTRTGLLLLVLMVGLTVPKFSYLLDVIGGSTLPLLSLVLPSIFYLRLTSDRFWQDGTPDKWKTGIFHKTFLGILIIFGILSAGVATYVSVLQMTSHATFVYPCYIKVQ